jgi:hypothetical protein
MSSRKDFLRAVGIIRAHDPELRTLLIDAFTDFFRGDNPRFDAARFEQACRKETTK